MLKLKTGEYISNEEIHITISRFLHKVIEENIPYTWYSTEEPFSNMYSGGISYDYSGYVKEMKHEELIKIKEHFGKSEVSIMMYRSNLEELLSSININQSIATHVSNYGLHWITYGDLLEELFRDWKYEKFDIYDYETEKEDEDLDIEVDDVYYDFLENTSYEIYYNKILKKLKKLEM